MPRDVVAAKDDRCLRLRIRRRRNDTAFRGVTQSASVAVDARRDRSALEALERQRNALVDGVLGAMRAEGLAAGTQQASEDRSRA